MVKSAINQEISNLIKNMVSYNSTDIKNIAYQMLTDNQSEIEDKVVKGCVDNITRRLYNKVEKEVKKETSIFD